jgi:predicted outer membrane repeat protein
MEKFYTTSLTRLSLILCTLLMVQPLLTKAFGGVQVQEKEAGHLQQDEIFTEKMASWFSGKTGKAAAQPSDTLSKISFKTLMKAAGKKNPAKSEAEVRAGNALNAARKSTSAAVLPIVFVKSNASGSNDGSSWENAYWGLAEALKYAHENPGVEQIWVANGSYYPSYDSDYIEQPGEVSRNHTFLLPADIKIFGGFVGTEQSPAERKLNIAEGNRLADEDEDLVSVLDGFGFAYHVVTYAGEVGSASLDGFVITGGNSNDGSTASINEFNIPRNVGGGIVAFNSSPSLSNLQVTGNSALDGGGIYASGSDFILTNSIVNANRVDGKGAVYLLNSSAIFTNNTIAASAEQTSATMVLAGAAPKIRNTIISANLSSSGLAVEVLDGSVPSFANSIVPGSGGSGSWNAAFGSNLGGNLDVDPAFFDETNGLLGLKPGSPAINKGNNLYFQSGQTPDLSGITTDLRGTPRITKNTVDIGALESLFDILSTSLTPNEDGILFVKKGGAGAKNGRDWNNAAAEVADALFATQLINVKQIWVAGGTYHPRYRPDDLSNADPKSPFNSFLMTGDIQLYGGFKGTESSPAERNLRLKENASILSGDFNQMTISILLTFITMGLEMNLVKTPTTSFTECT